MIVNFNLEGDVCWQRKRDLPSVPTVGSEVVWHNEATTERFVVVAVTYVCEEREWYKNNKEIGGDKTCLLLRWLPR